MIGIGVQSLRLQERVELGEIAALEQNNRFLMRRNVGCENESRRGQKKSRKLKKQA
jgi:hypothetical protein